MYFLEDVEYYANCPVFITQTFNIIDDCQRTIS